MKYIIALLLASVGAMLVYSGVMPVSPKLMAYSYIIILFTSIIGLFFTFSLNANRHNTGIIMFGVGVGMDVMRDIVIGNIAISVATAIMTAIAFYTINKRRDEKIAENKS